MDMAKWYILGAGKYFPKSQIVYDHFHIIKGMNDVVDRIRTIVLHFDGYMRHFSSTALLLHTIRIYHIFDSLPRAYFTASGFLFTLMNCKSIVRRREQKENPLLKNTRFLWLKNTSSMTKKEKRRFKSIKHLDLKTAKAYHLRVALQRLWTIPKIMARKYLERWISWAARTGIPEIVKYGKALKKHFEGIINAIMLNLSNSVAEGINNKIKTAFKRSYGFKSIEYRDTMIFLVAGKLELPTLLQG